MRSGIIAAFICAAASTPAAASDEFHPCADNGDSRAVIDRRIAFNRAIENADLETIEDVLADDVILVAGTRSDLYTGRDAQLAIWKAEFDSPDSRWIYVRTPDCIRISDVTVMAMEHGRWQGEGPDGSASGRYSAKWRVIDGQWRLEAEIFMTLECGGRACPESDE